MNCCSGVRLCKTSCPIDFALTESRKVLTTFTWTSASRSATADLAKGIIDVLFGDLALTPQPLEGELKLIG
jgi:hypothetical protein